MRTGYPHGKAGSSGFREAGLSGPVVGRSKPASNRLTQEVYDSSFLTGMPTSAPLAQQRSTELLSPVRGGSGRSKLREKILCHKPSANDHRCSIAKQSESDTDRCAILVSTDMSRQSSDNTGASAASPHVKTFVSSSPRPKSLNFDKPLLALPQRKSLNLNGPSPSISYADSIQTTPTDTSSSHRFSGTNRRHRLSSRTSVSYSDCSGLEDAGVNKSRDTMWGVYDTRGKPNTRRESPLNEKSSAIVETWKSEILTNSISAEDQSCLEEPKRSHPIWDTIFPNTLAPTPESLASNVVSPISPNFGFSTPMSNKFPTTKTIAKEVSPASNAASLVSVTRENPYLGSLDPHNDAADGWLSYSPPHLESGEMEHEHMRSDYKIYDPDVPCHRQVSYGLVSPVPRTQWATESSPTQPCLPREEHFNLVGPIHWSNIDESLEPETPSSMTKPIMTQFDAAKSINPAFLTSLACPTPLVCNLHEDSGFMYDSMEAVKAETPVFNFSPIGLNDDEEGLFQLRSPVGCSDQRSPLISPSQVIPSTPRSKANPSGCTPSQGWMQSQSRELQMSAGEVAGSEHDVASAQQCRPQLANVLVMSSSVKKSPHCSEHGSFLVTHSQSQQTLADELQTFFGVVNNDWMQKLKSDPELELRCSVLPPGALFTKGICTLRECIRGRVTQSFEYLFSLLHLAIAAASLLRYQQGFYCWDTFYNDALQWQHALSKDEDKALFLKAMDPDFRPSPLLYSNRRASLRDRMTDESIYSGDQMALPDALRRSEILKVCINFLEGRSMNRSFETHNDDSNRFIGFEKSGIGDRNLPFPAAALALHSQNRQWKTQHMITTITRPLQQERGIEALQGIVIDAESQIERGLLHEPREVEVTLHSSARVSSVSSPLPVSILANKDSVEVHISRSLQQIPQLGCFSM